MRDSEQRLADRVPRESLAGNGVTGVLGFLLVLLVYDLIFGSFKDFWEQLVFAVAAGILLGIVIGRIKPPPLLGVLLGGVIGAGGGLLITVVSDGLPQDWIHVGLFTVGSYYTIPGAIVGGLLGYHYQTPGGLG